MKFPYVKLLEKIGSIKIFLVDGSYIRNNISDKFTNFGHHFTYNFIPSNEIWLDNNTNPNERFFFAENALTEYKLMMNGESYEQAVTSANKKEKAIRKKSGLSVSAHKKKYVIKDLEYKKLWKIIDLNDDQVNVYIIDGEELRNKSGDLNFEDGGHGYVYPYINKNDIYIEKDLSDTEKKFILVHELREWTLMKYHNLSYKKAHMLANKEEWKERQNLESE